MKKGWEEKKLGEIIKLEYGKPLAAELRKPDGKYPVYGANGEKDRTDEYYVEKHSIIIGRKGSAGEINLTENKFWPLDVTYFVVFDDKKYDLKYIYYLLGNLELTKLAKGVKPGINRNEVYALDVKLPPLSQQQRIVAILNEAFSAIDKAKENAEKNLNNARELFDSYLESVFANPGDGWEEYRMSDIYDVRDGTHDSPKYCKTGFALVTSKNLKDNSLDFSEIKYISEEDYNKINERSKVDKGDILFAMIGTIGNPVVIEQEPDFAIKNVALFKVPSNQNSYYLKYYLESQTVIDKMKTDSKGTTQKFVGLGYLRNFIIRIPPYTEQERIVAKLNALLAETTKLEAIYEQKLTDLEELKKSILDKAFKGELTGGGV